MSDMSRRAFLKTGAATGAVSVSGLTVGPSFAAALLGAAGVTAGVTAAQLAAHGGRGPLVAYVRDSGRGELALVAGDREVTIQDHDLVLRLLKASR